MKHEELLSCLEIVSMDERHEELLKKDRKSMTYDEKCELLCQTRLTNDMTYEERFEMLKLRYGV